MLKRVTDVMWCGVAFDVHGCASACTHALARPDPVPCECKRRRHLGAQSECSALHPTALCSCS